MAFCMYQQHMAIHCIDPDNADGGLQNIAYTKEAA
jgi:hypothetical protein